MMRRPVELTAAQDATMQALVGCGKITWRPGKRLPAGANIHSLRALVSKGLANVEFRSVAFGPESYYIYRPGTS